MNKHFTSFLAAAAAIFLFANLGTARAESVKKTLGGITLICEKECENRHATFSRTLRKLNRMLNLVEINLGPIFYQYKPVEVHAGFDSVCQKIAPSYMNTAIAGFTYIREDMKKSAGVICLRDSLDGILANGANFRHELIHLYLYVHRYPEDENLEEPLTYLTVPCIFGCKASPQVVNSRPKTICDFDPATFFVRPGIAEFCARYDIEQFKIPLLFSRLAMRRRNGVLTNDILMEELANLSNR